MFRNIQIVDEKAGRPKEEIWKFYRTNPNANANDAAGEAHLVNIYLNLEI